MHRSAERRKCCFEFWLSCECRNKKKILWKKLRLLIAGSNLFMYRAGKQLATIFALENIHTYSSLSTYYIIFDCNFCTKFKIVTFNSIENNNSVEGT